MPREPLRPQGPLLKDLAGMASARAWGEELAQDLADYAAKRIPWSEVDKGALLHGEPGTGKTIFATALAATCKVPLIATSYAEWQRSKDGHLGDVLAAMHDDFKLAKKHAPCILFIDEIEAVSSRAAGGSNHRWYAGIITALNEQLHGVLSREGVVVIAATNHPDRVDPALLRPGRLDTRIAIPMPNAEDLRGIVRFHLRQGVGRSRPRWARRGPGRLDRRSRGEDRPPRAPQGPQAGARAVASGSVCRAGRKALRGVARSPGMHRHPRGRARGGGYRAQGFLQRQHLPVPYGRRQRGNLFRPTERASHAQGGRAADRGHPGGPGGRAGHPGRRHGRGRRPRHLRPRHGQCAGVLGGRSMGARACGSAEMAGWRARADRVDPSRARR